MKATFTAMRFSGGAGVRHMKILHALVLLLLLVLPIAKDGPLNLELVEWKFLLVLMLLLASLPEVGHIVRGDKYKQALVLATFSMVLTIVAYLLSDVQELSRELSLAMVANTLFLMALCRLFNADLLRSGITCIAIGSLVICTVAILQYVVIRFHLSHPALVALLPPEQQMGYFDLDLAVGSEGIRVSAVFFHSNQLGHYLAVAFALFFPLFLQAENRKNKVFYGMVTVAVTTCSLLSQSRGGLILIGLAVIFRKNIIEFVEMIFESIFEDASEFIASSVLGGR